MTEAAVHATLVWAVFALAAVTFVTLLRMKAPYGRHYTGRGWGPDIPNRAGWIVMESPATWCSRASTRWATPPPKRFRSFCLECGSATI